MREIYIQTEQLEKHKKKLVELTCTLKEDMRNIQNLWEKSLEKANAPCKAQYKEKWEREKEKGEEAVGHLEYLCRMEQYAAAAYEIAEWQMLKLLQEE